MLIEILVTLLFLCGIAVLGAILVMVPCKIMEFIVNSYKDSVKEEKKK